MILFPQSLKHFKNYLHALKYRVKFFPEDVEIELLEEITVRYFFLQVKAAILQDAIYCPPDTCVLLASYVLQAKHGDYSENVDTEIFSKQGLLPERYVNQNDNSFYKYLLYATDNKLELSQTEDIIESLYITRKD